MLADDGGLVYWPLVQVHENLSFYGQRAAKEKSRAAAC
jgi:hypothetical protein